MAQNYQSSYQGQKNIAQSYKFNEKFEDSEEIDDDEISQHEMKVKDMQNRVSAAGNQKYNLGLNGNQDNFYSKNGGNQNQQNMGNSSYTNGIQQSINIYNQNKNKMNDTPSKINDIQINLNHSTSEKPSAICLIQFHQDSNRMELGSRAIEILEKYSDHKICFVSIVGLYRSGKSALLNKLLDIRSGEGFKVDDSVNACTMGIWMWSNPQYNENDDLYIFFIDTEGLQSVEQTQDHDIKIFTLTMLISSFFIYNSKGVIDETSISQLGLVTKLTKNIAVNEYGDKMDEYMLAQYTPKFLWILRDFSLELQDQKGRRISANQYLENCLMEDGNTKVQQSKNVRKAILSYFKDRSCLTMVKPISEEDKLKIMDRLQLEDLRSEFQKQIIALRALIFQKCTPKMFNGQYLNGRMMISMIETFINNINHKEGIPNIQSAWENIVQNECILGHQVGLQQFESQMKTLLENRETAVDFMELYTNFRAIRDNVLEKYDSIAGIREKNQYYHQYRMELINHMESREQQAFEQNEEIASTQNDLLIQDLTKGLNEKFVLKKFNHKNINEYISEFNEQLINHFLFMRLFSQLNKQISIDFQASMISMQQE
ncbi:amine-terminal domain guanylate-binding protein (macronuclear) [Tetrahymena thermophila SB210]|uniref:Amine-terminal domain guanylate-binding protein n=1 Tax=Tetrahymena thermophila (strain SB210) TaxID=312017 RepID=I7M4A3_TETTS|nr:amine-terminal domain guanylate-binding protein [Tetrahymena thermophila SB210]EAS06098.2 amine-terminal domain guanylate-binding protein [Tetrahymena thermophila SB210]|eukprot:XP_001026343.2 amine-terminal domain guanylate-binding protein [Tetrahymena thermophila SB210]